MQLAMIFVAGTAVALLAAVVVLTLTRHASRSDEARRQVEVEQQRIRERDTGIADEFVAALDAGRNIEEAMPEAHRNWQQLFPRGWGGNPSADWDDDDLAAAAAEETARRQDHISRQSMLFGGLGALAVLFVAGTTLLLLWSFDQPNQGGRSVKADRPAAVAEPPDSDPDEPDADEDEDMKEDSKSGKEP